MQRNSFEIQSENKERKEQIIKQMMRQNSSMKDYKILQQKMALRRL